MVLLKEQYASIIYIFTMKEQIHSILDNLIDERIKFYQTFKDAKRNPDEFMKKLNWSPEVISIFSKDDQTKQTFQKVLNTLNPNLAENTPQKLREAIQNLKEKISFGGLNLIDFKPVNGKDLRVEVKYNSDKLNINYAYEHHATIKQLVKKFVRLNLDELTGKATENVKKVRVMDQKRYTQDKYTNSYLFDPFFNSIKFFISLRDQKSFPNYYIIKFAGNIPEQSIRFTDSPQKKVWQEDCKFQSKDPVQKLVNYICDKENADANSRKTFLGELSLQDIRIIEDLLKQQDIKPLLQKISKTKWSCQLQIELRKIVSPAVKSGFEKYSRLQNKDDYFRCLQQGYSHKIFRYLFAMTNGEGDLGLSILSKKIPSLNPQVVSKAIQLVNKELIMDSLFEELQGEFKTFSFIPPPEQAPKYQPPMGMLFYGPPGTGKTRLTEDLAELMGFHLVENGLSSANFQKELVGEAKGTVQSYLGRAYLSPHLICSIAIDEIDPLVMRRDRQQKNSTETISKILSMIGGIETVPNLLVLASTNHKGRIDEAIIRRFVPNIYVGLPNKEQRRKIILSYLPKASSYVDFLVEITPNFSGAALKQLSNAITSAKNQSGKSTLNQLKLLQIAKRTAINFSILFGEESYQNIYSTLSNGKKITRLLFDSFQNKVILLTGNNDSVTLTYGIQEQFFDENIKPCYQICQASIPISTPLDQPIISSWLGSQFDPNINCPSSAFFQLKLQNIKEPLLLYYEIKKEGQLKEILPLLRNNQNHYICLFANTKQLREDELLKIFAQGQQLEEPKSVLTGRILVDFTAGFPSKMEIQRKYDHRHKLQVIKQPFIRGQPVIKTLDALPEVVDFLIKHNVSNIQMIDNNFFTRRGAYQEQECLENLENIKEECTKYHRSALIIYLDSLIMVNRSYSNSSSGISDSYAISQPNMYHSIINLLNNFGKVTQDGEQRWVVLIVEETELSKMVKKSMKWPLNAHEKESEAQSRRKQEEEKRKKEIRVCLYCRQKYTQQENEKSRTCMNHYGAFMDLDNCKQLEIQPEQAKFRQFQINMNREQEVKCFVHTCCWGYLGAEGCEKFHHFSGLPSESDEVSNMKAKTAQFRWEKCRVLAQSQTKRLKKAISPEKK